ncbi:MAG: o-succinylbenzoate synthase [Pleurocapsa sp. SU_196_0]|nr:o-succinylbenzoate synthase [Pleurocapsa sp. SU_196_0]
MKIERIELREFTMPMKTPFETSFGVTQARRMILVAVSSGGLTGYGEVSCNETPGYSYETTDTAWVMLNDFFAPAVIGKELHRPEDFAGFMKPFRGASVRQKRVSSWHCGDLWARAANQPLWKFIGGTKTELPVGLSIGIKSSPEALAEFVTEQKALGYRRLKLKIGRGRDVQFVKAAREAIGFDTNLTVDANSDYTLGDIDLLRELDQYKLQYIEQPLENDDIVDHATLARSLETPLCLDEPIHALSDVRKAHALGSGKVINLKIGRVGGHTESHRIAAFCAEHGIDLWCGGMLESGVGRAHNVALQTLSAFTLASDTAPSARYWAEDIIEPEITMHDGITKPLDGIGLGVTLKHDLIERLTTRVQVF